MDQAERFGGRNLGWLARTRHRLSRAGWLRETQERADGRCAESRDTENRSQYHGGQFLFVNAGNEKTDSAAERPKKRLIVRLKPRAKRLQLRRRQEGLRQSPLVGPHPLRLGQGHPVLVQVLARERQALQPRWPRRPCSLVRLNSTLEKPSFNFLKWLTR